MYRVGPRGESIPKIMGLHLKLPPSATLPSKEMGWLQKTFIVHYAACNGHKDFYGTQCPVTYKQGIL